MVLESLLLNRGWPDRGSRGNSHQRSSNRIIKRKEWYAVLNISFTPVVLREIPSRSRGVRTQPASRVPETEEAG